VPTCTLEAPLLLRVALRTVAYADEVSWALVRPVVLGTGETRVGQRKMLVYGGALPRVITQAFLAPDGATDAMSEPYKDSREITAYVCSPAGVLNVYMFDSYGDGWGDGASLSVSFVTDPTAAASYELFNGTAVRFNSSGVVQLYNPMPASLSELQTIQTSPVGNFTIRAVVRVQDETYKNFDNQKIAVVASSVATVLRVSSRRVVVTAMSPVTAAPPPPVTGRRLSEAHEHQGDEQQREQGEGHRVSSKQGGLHLPAFLYNADSHNMTRAVEAAAAGGRAVRVARRRAIAAAGSSSRHEGRFLQQVQQQQQEVGSGADSRRMLNAFTLPEPLQPGIPGVTDLVLTPHPDVVPQHSTLVNPYEGSTAQAAVTAVTGLKGEVSKPPVPPQFTLSQPYDIKKYDMSDDDPVIYVGTDPDRAGGPATTVKPDKEVAVQQPGRLLVAQVSQAGQAHSAWSDVSAGSNAGSATGVHGGASVMRVGNAAWRLSRYQYSDSNHASGDAGRQASYGSAAAASGAGAAAAPKQVRPEQLQAAAALASATLQPFQRVRQAVQGAQGPVRAKAFLDGHELVVEIVEEHHAGQEDQAAHHQISGDPQSASVHVQVQHVSRRLAAVSSTALDLIIQVKGFATRTEANDVATNLTKAVTEGSLLAEIKRAGWDDASLGLASDPVVKEAAQLDANGNDTGAAPTMDQSSSDSKKVDWKKIAIIVGSVVGGCIVIAAIIALLVKLTRKKSGAGKVAPMAGQGPPPPPPPPQQQPAYMQPAMMQMPMYPPPQQPMYMQPQQMAYTPMLAPQPGAWNAGMQQQMGMAQSQAGPVTPPATSAVPRGPGQQPQSMLNSAGYQQSQVQYADARDRYHDSRSGMRPG